MTAAFGATSTTDDVLQGIDLHGKRVLVTGVSAGLGVETARFQAFKDRSEELPPAWEMKAPGSRIGLLAGIVVVVAILAAILGYLLV